MRRLGLSLVGIAIMALLGGAGGAVLAQGDPDAPVTATPVTGEVTDYRPVKSGIWAEGAGLNTLTDDQYELEIAWSDPRLPTLKRGRETLYVYDRGDDLEAHALSGTIRLEGPEGAFAGTAHGLGGWSAEAGRQMTKVMLLDGEDAYDGLHAVIVATIDEAVSPFPSYEGFIYEGDAPPFPETVEPFTESTSGSPAAGQEAVAGATAAAEQPSAASTTIGFTNFYQDGGFFSDIEAGAQEAASAAGVDLLVETAWGSSTTQANQVDGFIEDGVDAIIITPVDPDAIVASVEAANAAGIPVLAVDRAASGGTLASVIASDNVAAGRMAGEALFEAMGGNGKVIEIQGDMAVSSGALRSEGFGEALAAAPDITLAVQAPAYFDYGMALHATQQALEDDPEITGVFASNLDMLYGAVEGVAAAGQQGQVRVTGVDVDPDILAMAWDGSIDATVAQQPRLMGQKAVEAALAAAAGEPVEPFIPVETILVTADNVEAFMAGESVGAEEAEGEAASPVPVAEVTPSEEPDVAITWPQLTRSLEYGDDPKQVIHVYELEPRSDPRPALVFFHGGGLVFGQPLQDADWARWMAEQGYVTFMAGYRLFGEVDGANPWPAQLEDAQRAIQWIRAHADEYNVDPERVCAIGHSSGGHLAGLVGTTGTTDSPDPELAGISSRVDCVVSISGDADLMVPYENSYWTGVFDQMLGGTVEEVPEVWQAASPTHNVDADTVPFLIIHGNHDEEVPVEMARNLADALAEARKEFVYAEVDAGHLDVGNPEATGALQETFLSYQPHPEE